MFLSFFSLNEYFWSEIFLISFVFFLQKNINFYLFFIFFSSFFKISLITFFTIVFRVLFLVADLRLTINILTSGYMHAKPLQSCLTLRSPIDRSPPGSSVHGDSPGKISGMGCHVLPQGIFWPEIEPVSLNVFYRSPHPV